MNIRHDKHARLRRARSYLASLLQLQAAPWRWTMAIEAGLGMALTLGAWTIADRQPYGLVASLGVFTALYCPEWTRSERAIALPLIGIGIVLASAVGVACSANAMLAVLGLVFVAALAGAVTLAFAMGPPGPLMFVLVSGVSGYIATHTRATGGPITPVMIPLLVACGVLAAYIVVIAPLAVPRIPAGTLAGRSCAALFRRWSLNDEAQLILSHVIAASLLAGVIGAWLGVQRTYWIVVAAVAVIQKSNSWQITSTRALHRVLGTFVGLGLFAGVQALEPTGLLLVLVITVLQFLIELVVARNYGLALLFITPLALNISLAAHPQASGEIVAARLWDTVLGAATALAVFWSSARWRQRS